MLKRFIFWDYPRGSRPYDLIVGIILAFIFLTPREVFHDQPRIPKASHITMLPSEKGSYQFIVDAADLEKIPESDRVPKLTTLVQTSMSDRRLRITRVEPILNSEGELQGYIVVARP